MLHGWVHIITGQPITTFSSVEWNTRPGMGKMVVAKGTDFEISWPFTGMIPCSHCQRTNFQKGKAG